MKFTLNWLKEHLDTSANIKTICDTLTNIGLEVENYLDREEELKPFRVAKVLKAEKHPDADRLKICDVETIDGNFQVVCGAPNAKTGMKGIFAPENSFIPGTKIKLKKSKIRGVESCGMLVSEKEMGISEEHDGIIEIDNKYNIGDFFSHIYGIADAIIEINITPNRSDCLSVRGVARDLSAAGLGKLKKIEKFDYKPSFKSPIKWKRNFSQKQNYLCPGVSGRYFSDIKNCESPLWLKNRLIAIGLRPISALVDITNYITFDLGRPLHVYDADKINGDLTMRLATQSEKCKTLDEKEYLLNDDNIVISDNISLHGIGGVMGGYNSGCSLETKNVFLEVALFDPASISSTGRKINLQSDARYRFERGIDEQSVYWGVEEATKLINKICGGKISEITSDIYKIKKNKIINFAKNKIIQIGGIDISEASQISILEKLEFKLLNNSKDFFEIEVPSHRPDIEGEADIVEEILRIYGFDKIKPKSIINDFINQNIILKDSLKAFYKSKKILSSRGYYETVTWSFTSSKIENIFNSSNLIKIKNPISEDLNVMRSNILPNLLMCINKNINKLYEKGKIFEVGPQFGADLNNNQEMMATAIHYGKALSKLWNHETRNVDIFDIKSDLMFVLSQLNVPINKIKYDTVNSKLYHPGKSSSLKISNNIIANFGEIHPFILKNFNIKTNVCALEIYLDKLEKFQIIKSSKPAYDNNSLQIIERDFAFVFKNEVKTIEIVNRIKQVDKQRIKKVSIFDVFKDSKISDNSVSVAFKVLMQPLENTFNEDEIDKISNSIIDDVTNTFDAKLR